MILIYRKYLEYESINTFLFLSFLAEERRLSQPLIISLGLILLLFTIGLALAIPFFVIPSYKASELFKCLVHFPEVLIYAINTF